MNPSQYICSQINFPICRALNLEVSNYVSKPGVFLGTRLSAPSTLSILFFSLLMTSNMIKQCNKMYSSIGGDEMKVTYYFYIISTVILMISCGFESYVYPVIFKILASMQLSFYSTMFFSIFSGGITVDRIYGIMGISSGTFMLGVCLVYFGLIQVFILTSVLLGNEFVHLIVFFINSLSFFLYFLIQVKKLKQIDSDIWSYGVLAIALFFYVISLIHMVIGAEFIAKYSERSVDNLFFMCLYNFIMVTMIHKYWLGICDFEVESLTLDV